MSDTKARVRFAPSPTGFLHIGNARTALFNYLYARSTGGSFILRVEDTDLERSDRKYEDALIEDLRWLGLEWDEGPDIGGPVGPYRQSERLDVYRKYLDRLLVAGKAYPCFCTPEELDARREEAMAAGKPVVYDGRCGRLSSADRLRLDAEGRPISYRYRVPDEKVIIEDLVRGQVEFDGALIGDTVIMKSDGMPTFHFGVAVDDALMGVTCVLRGEGHLPNAPVQAFLAKDLGFAPPLFAHMSQTLSPEGGKLSKRKGAMSLREFRERGYLPEAVVNYMALLGWSPGNNVEFLTLADAIRLFDVRGLTKSAALFDQQKFAFICRQHMHAADPARLADLAAPILAKAAIRVDDRERLTRLVTLARERAEKVEDFPELIRPYVEMPAFDEGGMAVLAEDGATEVLRVFAERLKAQGGATEPFVRLAFKETQGATGKKGRSLYMPVRVALTGSTTGPEIVEIVPILGLGEVVRRLDLAREAAEGRR